LFVIVTGGVSGTILLLSDYWVAALTLAISAVGNFARQVLDRPPETDPGAMLV